MIKLKKLLGEAGYKGDTYYSRGEWFSRSDDKASLATKTKPEWDAFVDKYNSMPGFETTTKADGKTYSAEIKNLETGLRWIVQSNGGNNWSYIGRKVGYTGNPEFLRDVEALIANFEEINGNI